jgi:hypothetical protein
MPTRAKREITVAIAAPWMPRSKPKMNIGSSTAVSDAGAKRHIHRPLGVADGAQQGGQAHACRPEGSDGNTICMNSVASSAVCPWRRSSDHISQERIGERHRAGHDHNGHVEE